MLDRSNTPHQTNESLNRFTPIRDHLFISYAWEDGALAEWLTLKLTAEGYRVWCDRFKMLGGERWPEDIDEAIKTRTFRMLHLLSKHSLHKENPAKERQLALTLSKVRAEEFLIPLNLDGTIPTDLPWQLTDIAYIPFQNWANGLGQLLEKLKKIGAPRPVSVDGKKFAIDTFLPGKVLLQQEDILQSNCLKFIQVPSVVKRYLLSRPLSKSEQEALFERWAHYKIDDELILAFSAPDNAMPGDIIVTEDGGASWPDVPYIERVSSKSIVSSLLKKSLIVKCLQKGLKRDLRSAAIYFPDRLLERNRLGYRGYKGRMTRIDVVGERKALKARSHLGFVFSIRQDIVNGYAVLVKIILFLTDEDKQPFDFKVALRKRKRITKSWWNHQWLSRHVAIRSFLSDGTDVITIGKAGNSQVRLSAVPIIGTLGVAIDESYLQPIRAGLVVEQDAGVDESGDFESGIENK
jgi:hypothetical protein